MLKLISLEVCLDELQSNAIEQHIRAQTVPEPRQVLAHKTPCAQTNPTNQKSVNKQGRKGVYLIVSRHIIPIRPVLTQAAAQIRHTTSMYYTNISCASAAVTRFNRFCDINWRAKFVLLFRFTSCIRHTIQFSTSSEVGSAKQRASKHACHTF